MGIAADAHGIDMDGLECGYQAPAAANPRRVYRGKVTNPNSGKNIPDHEKTICGKKAASLPRPVQPQVCTRCDKDGKFWVVMV